VKSLIESVYLQFVIIHEYNQKPLIIIFYIWVSNAIFMSMVCINCLYDCMIVLIYLIPSILVVINFIPTNSISMVSLRWYTITPKHLIHFLSSRGLIYHRYNTNLLIAILLVLSFCLYIFRTRILVLNTTLCPQSSA